MIGSHRQVQAWNRSRTDVDEATTIAHRKHPAKQNNDTE